MEIDPNERSDNSKIFKHEEEISSTKFSDFSRLRSSFVRNIYQFMHTKFKMIYDFVISKIKAGDNLLTARDDSLIRKCPEAQDIESLLLEDILLESLTTEQQNILFLHLKYNIYSKFKSRQEDFSDIDNLATKFLELFRTDITMNQLDEQLKLLLNQSASIEDFDNLLNELPFTNILKYICSFLQLKSLPNHLFESTDLLKELIDFDTVNINEYLHKPFQRLQQEQPAISQALCYFFQRGIKYSGILEQFYAHEQNVEDYLDIKLKNNTDTIATCLQAMDIEIDNFESDFQEAVIELYNECSTQSENDCNMTVHTFLNKDIQSVKYFAYYIRDKCFDGQNYLHLKECLVIAFVIANLNKNTPLNDLYDCYEPIQELLDRYKKCTLSGKQDFRKFLQSEAIEIINIKPDLTVEHISENPSYEAYIIQLCFVLNISNTVLIDIDSIDDRVKKLARYYDMPLKQFGPHILVDLG